MRKVASSRLAWSFTLKTYQVEEAPSQELLEIAPGSPAWFAWLDHISSFAFWRRSACSYSTAQRAEHPACPVALYQAPSASSAQASGLPFSPRRAPSAGNGVPLHAHLSPRGVWQNHPACPMACPERSACRLALA